MSSYLINSIYQLSATGVLAQSAGFGFRVLAFFLASRLKRNKRFDTASVTSKTAKMFDFKANLRL